MNPCKKVFRRKALKNRIFTNIQKTKNKVNSNLFHEISFPTLKFFYKKLETFSKNVSAQYLQLTPTQLLDGGFTPVRQTNLFIFVIDNNYFLVCFYDPVMGHSIH